tara:strand:- start:695 stop:1363 length:669 start_codon:yes stop_codon:yes gene_type:complete
MILAAGFGERLKPLTLLKPKALLSIDGKPLIVRIIGQLALAGIKDIVINLGYRGSLLKKYLGDGSSLSVRIQYSQEPEDAPLDTGAGIAKALPLLGHKPFVVVSADIWTDFGFHQLLHTSPQFIVVPKPEGYHGDFALEGNKLSQHAAASYTYANMGVFDPRWFASFKKERFPLSQVMYHAIEHDLVKGVCYQGAWFNVGTLDVIEDVRTHLYGIHDTAKLP